MSGCSGLHYILCSGGFRIKYLNHHSGLERTYSHLDFGQHSPDSGISESHLLSPVPLAVCHCHWCHLGHCMCSSKFLDVSYHKHISGIRPLLSISGSQTTRCGSPPVCPAVGPSLRHCPGQAPDLGPGVCLQEESNHERGKEKPTRYKVQKVLKGKVYNSIHISSN